MAAAYRERVPLRPSAPEAEVARDYGVSSRWVYELTEDGELIRELTLDPTRDYQSHGPA